MENNDISDLGENSELLLPIDKEKLPTYFVAIGASAGGLEAIEQFFIHMPSDSDMAFIVIQHLSPDYKSLMVELLSKRTKMPVYRAESGMPVEKNAVYLIPPKKNLTIFHGRLILTDQDRSSGQIVNLPIDIFLNSLAEDQSEKSIAIIMSGTGSDGLRGARAIKEAGGLVIAQDLDTVKFDGMPRSVISAGLADFILPPEKMPEVLIKYSKNPQLEKNKIINTILGDEEGLSRIFAILREKHKVDFTYYKMGTIIRRIHRRMNILQIPELRDYIMYLEKNSKEVTNLYKELLIGVTSFFRDKEAFDELKKILYGVFQEFKENTYRIWVAGCSTGEEAYSIAMICQDILNNLNKNLDFKIFATDIDNDALIKAGSGIYPDSIVGDVEPELIQKYFYHREKSFQVIRSIREKVVFAQQNLIKDPPFTRINLISCRNFLIYLQPILQKKILELFNFSLTGDGILFLGSSETIGELVDLFEPINHKWKIFKSKGKKIRAEQYAESNLKLGFYFTNYGNRALKRADDEKLSEQLIEALTGEYFSKLIIINENLEVIHLFGDPSPLFKLPTGKMVNDISKMTIKEFSAPFLTALQRAIRNKEEVKYHNIIVKLDNETLNFNLHIKPIKLKRIVDNNIIYYAIIIDSDVNKELSNEVIVYNIDKETQQRISELEQELQYTKESLQATIEELETSNEELQATNEELIASNEELQSTNEELQSVNEELFTVNSEYQKKILELTQLNNDIENLLKNIDIATIFLDENFQIRRFTPKIKEIFSIIDTDIGRPISHINHIFKNFNIEDILIKTKLKKIPIEIEIKGNNDKFYLLKFSPYYISPDKTDGVIITIIDITKHKHYENDALKILQLQKDCLIKNEIIQSLMNLINDMTIIIDKNKKIIEINEKMLHFLNLTRDDIQSKPLIQFINDNGLKEFLEENLNLLNAELDNKYYCNINNKNFELLIYPINLKDKLDQYYMLLFKEK